MKRLLNINTNAPGLSAAAAAVYAAAVMVWNATHHQGVIDPQVIVAGVAALVAFFTRQVVTPVADPKDLSGRPLVVAAPAEPPPAVTAATTAPPPRAASF